MLIMYLNVLSVPPCSYNDMLFKTLNFHTTKVYIVSQYFGVGK